MKHRSVPLLPVLLYAKLIETFASMIPGKSWEPAITTYGLRQVTRTLRLDITEAQRQLGWTPRLTFEEGMEELD